MNVPVGEWRHWGEGAEGVLATEWEGERLTSEQQLPPPQVCLDGREVAGNRVDAHASALEPVRCRPAASGHLERSHPQRRRRFQQHPAAQQLPAAVGAAPLQLQREAADAPGAHGAGLGARPGARPPGAPRAFRVSGPVPAAPGARALSPASANLCRCPGPGADFLVLPALPRDAPGPAGTCCPCARVVDFATPQRGAGPVFVGSALMSQRRTDGAGADVAGCVGAAPSCALRSHASPHLAPLPLGCCPSPLSPPPAPVTYWFFLKHAKLRSCLLAFALTVLLLGTPSPDPPPSPLVMEPCLLLYAQISVTARCLLWLLHRLAAPKGGHPFLLTGFHR